MPADQHCPVCGLSLDEINRAVNRDAYELVCQRCGRYIISGTLMAVKFPTASAEQRAGLMAALREASDRGEIAVLTTENWESVAGTFASISIPQKLRRLLEFIGAKSRGKAGSGIAVNGELEFPRFGALDATEFHWLRRALFQQGLLEPDPNILTLTLEGWEAYRPGKGGTPGTCFVAMAFGPDLNAAYDVGIRPAVVEDCGFSIVRVDRVEHNDNINDRIIGEIRSSQFVVADFTLHRNGVYFEAGFAMGLGRPVVWTCRRDQLPEAHFDTRPYNHVVWDTAEELRSRLASRIRATVLK